MSTNNNIYEGIVLLAHDLETMRKQYERLRHETAILRYKAAFLRAEVKAWRDADSRHDLTRNVMGEGHNEDVLAAMQATDALDALNEENKQ